jgi:hypothetical protein
MQHPAVVVTPNAKSAGQAPSMSLFVTFDSSDLVAFSQTSKPSRRISLRESTRDFAVMGLQTAASGGVKHVANGRSHQDAWEDR